MGLRFYFKAITWTKNLLIQNAEIWNVWFRRCSIKFFTIIMPWEVFPIFWQTIDNHRLPQKLPVNEEISKFLFTRKIDHHLIRMKQEIYFSIRFTVNKLFSRFLFLFSLLWSEIFSTIFVYALPLYIFYCSNLF